MKDIQERILITEGKFDAELLEKILPISIKENIKIVEGKGSSSALSLARSYYAKGQNKVLIVIDSDSVDERQIREKKNFAESALNMISSNGEIKVILFVPELDSLLFKDKTFMEDFFSKSISPLEFALYQRDPKFAYTKLSSKPINQTRMELLTKINDNLIEQIIKDDQVVEMLDFLK